MQDLVACGNGMGSSVILRLKVEELDNISDLTINDIRIISKFRKAIKENNLIAFLVGEEGKNGNK